MKEITLLIAQSLDGYVATPDGGVGWLDEYNVPDEDYGVINFMEEMDTVIQGNTTYKQFTPAYPGKNSYVFTRDTSLSADDGTIFVTGGIREFVDGLDEKTHKNIWLVGGPALAAQFFDENLINKLVVHMMPIFLNEGIALFSHIKAKPKFKLTFSKAYKNGVIEMHYDVK